MKYTTSNEQLKAFQKNRLIEFEGFLSAHQLHHLKEEIEKSIAQRTKHSPEQSVKDLFQSGRDLWRSSDHLKKIILQKSWAEIASELAGKNILRIAFDQLFIINSNLGRTEALVDLLPQKTSLEEFSTIRGVACGLMICLHAEENLQENKEEDHSEYPSIFPNQSGNAIFFLPNASIDFSTLCTLNGGQFFLIVYAQANANYLLQPKDPNTHFLKQLGYIFGEPLNDALHPIVYRK